MRPCFPIIFPMSAWATRTSMRVVAVALNLTHVNRFRIIDEGFDDHFDCLAHSIPNVHVLVRSGYNRLWTLDFDGSFGGRLAFAACLIIWRTVSVG